MLGNPNASQGERSLEDTEKRESRGAGGRGPKQPWGSGGPRVSGALQEAWKLGLGTPRGAPVRWCQR